MGLHDSTGLVSKVGAAVRLRVRREKEKVTEDEVDHRAVQAADCRHDGKITRQVPKHQPETFALAGFHSARNVQSCKDALEKILQFMSIALKLHAQHYSNSGQAVAV